MGSRRGDAVLKHFALLKTKSFITLIPIVATISSSAPPYWTRGVAELGHLRNLNLDRDVPKGEFCQTPGFSALGLGAAASTLPVLPQGFHHSILRQSRLLQSE